MAQVRLFTAGTLAFALALTLAATWGAFRRDESPRNPPAPPPSGDGMVAIPAGTFRMGNDLSEFVDQRPAHDVSIRAFRMDRHEVTNRQFRRFVDETGYRTTAEERGWSNLFDRKGDCWVRTDGADWQHPGGPHDSLLGRDDYPVVHVSWHDAVAYADWAGKRLPTEAQWEYAARSGLRDADFPWGREETVDGRYRANTRQHGKQPDADGFDGLAPVGSFPASRFGLYDMSGNVWEWCADWYAEDAYRTGPGIDPTGPAQGDTRVLRGGSWLSPEGFRCGHHVSTRHKLRPDESYAHVGFRCRD